MCKSFPVPNLALLTSTPVASGNLIMFPFVFKSPPSCGEVSATRSVSTTANVESPLKKVEELAVPDPNLAVGTVPDARLDAFKLVKLAPLPLKLVADKV